MLRTLATVLFVTIAAGSCSLAAAADEAPAPAVPSAAHLEFFENKVRPLLVEKCYRCHSADSVKRGKLKAGLRLDSLVGLLKGGDSGSALTPGDPGKSRLIEAINYRNEDMAMPPKGKLSGEHIAILTEWVKIGSPWPGENTASAQAPEKIQGEAPYDWAKFRREHWSFRPITKAALPEVDEETWSHSPIDRLVFSNLQKASIQPNGPADKRILIRRAYLDLIGLPPAPEQVDAFLADTRADAFAKVVDELLSSKHHGERWARHWLDVARYSDGHGGFGDNKALPNAWRYRTWVVDAFNNDMPFDQFVVGQIAGDMIENNPDPVGTGFFVVGPTYTSDGGDPEAKAQAEAETLSDRVDTFSRAFLGLTAACARCHNHKFDPITTQDYYAIAGIFKNTGNGDHPVASQSEIDAYNAAQKAIGEQNKKVNEYLNTEAKRLGIDRKKVEKSLDEESKKNLSVLRTELDRLKKSEPPNPPSAHVLREVGSADMHVALRGDLRKEGERVPRRFLQIVAGEEPAAYTKGSGRLELARSVTAPDNPLTARVIVNRVWGWHFGRALVRTPSNFGVLGEKPTHPELLDWLAADFIEHGWSLKRLHRQILLSATWQMSSDFDRDKFARDGDNRMLWRMNPRRLEVEAWRDSLLAVTGELDRTIGGPPAGEILRSTRRTLYATISRTGDRFESDAFLRLFDFPAAVSTSAKRTTSTVPQQYLFMMNSPFMTARAKTLGTQLHELNKTRGSISECVSQAYHRLYSRAPEPAELELAAEWLGKSASPETWQQYAQVLLSAHELIQIR